MNDKLIDYHIKINVIYLGFGMIYAKCLLIPISNVEANTFSWIVFWIIWHIFIRSLIERPDSSADKQAEK